MTTRTIRGWTPAELDRRALPLAGLVRRAWRTVATHVYQSLVGSAYLSVDDLGGVTREWLEQVRSPLVVGYVRRQLLEAGAHVRGELGGVAAALDVFETPGGADLVRDYLREMTLRLGGVGGDVWLNAREALIAATREGLSPEEAALRVRDATGISLGRARRIALTEVHAAHEAGTHAQVLALDPGATKTWDAKLDDRTRLSHRHLDGQTARVRDTFDVGGFNLRFPGDPLGPPHETVSCRCRLRYTLSSLDIIAGMTTSDPSEPISSVTALFATAAAAAAAGYWNPEAHPRGRDGKFIEKGLADVVTGKLTGQKVVSTVAKASQKQLANLTSEQKSKIVKAAGKIPAQTTTSAITGHKGKKPGEVAKVTTTLIWGKHKDGQVILTSGDGEQRLRWNGKTKKYEPQTLTKSGWSTDTTWTKKDAYETLKGDNDWIVPTDEGELPETVLTSPPQATLAVPPKVTPGQKSPSSSQAFSDFANLEKISGQKGSNLGGWFRDVDGDRFYVKKAKSDDHAANEVLAANLYVLAGVDTPQITRGFGAPNIGGGLQTATPEVKNAKTNLEQKLGDKSYLDQLRSGFAVDAWLANWDVAGLTYDNVVDSGGQPVRIDVGGTLLYRAMGAPKGDAFGDTVSEIDTLRDAKMNAQSSAIFGSMTYDQIRESAKRLLPITPEMIGAEVASAGFAGKFADELTKRLVARRQNILERFDLVVPANVDTPPASTPVATSPTDVVPTTSTSPTMKSVIKDDTLNEIYVDASHPDGQVVAQRSDDQWRITYDATTTEFQLQQRSVGGSWIFTDDLNANQVMYRLNGLHGSEAKWEVPAEYFDQVTRNTTTSIEPTSTTVDESLVLDGASIAKSLFANVDSWRDGHVVAVSSDGIFRITYDENNHLAPLSLEKRSPTGAWDNIESYFPVTDTFDDVLTADTGVITWVSPTSTPGKTLMQTSTTPPTSSETSNVIPVTHTPDDEPDWEMITNNALNDLDLATSSNQPVAVSVDGQFKITYSAPNSDDPLTLWVKSGGVDDDAGKWVVEQGIYPDPHMMKLFDVVHEISTSGWVTPESNLGKMLLGEVTTEPESAETSVMFEDLDDAATIPEPPPVWKQKAWKSTLSGKKVGYYSKPEKIWTEILAIVASEKSAGNIITPLDVIKSLDAQTKTKEPTPFETKMVKWTQTIKGIDAVQGGLAGLGTVSPAPQNYVGPPPAGATDVDIDAVIQSGDKLTDPLDVWLAVNENDTPEGAVVAYAVNLGSNARFRLVAKKLDNGTALASVQTLLPDGSWSIVEQYSSSTDSHKLLSQVSSWSSAINAPKIGSAPVPGILETPYGVITVGGGNISHLDSAQRQQIFTAFKSAGAPGLKSSNLKIWNALKKVVDDTPGLTTLQALRVIDAVSADGAGVADKQLFEKKITAWLKTPHGYAAVTGQKAPRPATPAFDPKISFPARQTRAQSDAHSYAVIDDNDVNTLWDEITSKSAPWTTKQRAAVKSYTGGVYNTVNNYLHGKSTTIDSKAQTLIDNLQQAMRPSTRPMELHRATGLDELGVSSFSQLNGIVGQVRKGESFNSTNVGPGWVWSGTIRLVIEAPPGTPMAWAMPVSLHKNEREMILAAGLNYQIIEVWTAAGYHTVRLRVVP